MSDFDIREILAQETARNDQVSAAMANRAEEAQRLMRAVAIATAAWVNFLLDIGTEPENIAASLASTGYAAITNIEEIRKR